MKALLLTFLFCVCIGCTSNPIKLFLVQNLTDKAIEIDIEFLVDGKLSLRKMNLEPGHLDDWLYDGDQLDERLRSMTIRTEDGCETSLDRSAIEKIAKHPGHWDIILKAQIVGCGTIDIEPEPFKI